MGTVVIDRSEVCEAAQRVAERMGEMLRLPGAGARRIPGAQWTVAETACHLAMAQAAFVEMATGVPIQHGDGTKQGLARANAQKLIELPERDPAAHAGVIVSATRAFAAASAGRPGDQQVRSPMGDMDLDTLASYLLAHTAMHGCAVARALHRPLPLGRQEVLMTLPFLTSVLPAMVNRETAEGLSACYLLHLRGGPSLSVTFTDGALSASSQPPRRVDCHISADPVAFLLVALGLASQWGQIARGRMVAYGRKPWLAFRLVGLLSVP